MEMGKCRKPNVEEGESYVKIELEFYWDWSHLHRHKKFMKDFACREFDPYVAIILTGRC